MTTSAYSVPELVAALNALRFDSEDMDDVRNHTVKMLVAHPNDKAWVNEAIWLVKIPVLHSGVYGTPCPIYKAQSDYNGGPEDDFSFEVAVRLYEGQD